MFCQRGREVYIFANGNIKKVHTCKVKPFKCEVTIDIEEENNTKKERNVTIQSNDEDNSDTTQFRQKIEENSDRREFGHSANSDTRVQTEENSDGREFRRSSDSDTRVQTEENSDRRKFRRSIDSEDIEEKEEMKKDTIGTYWMLVENNECYNDEITTYVVELPVSQHNTPEVHAAKAIEIQNLNDYETFEEVEDCGQERISRRWVITVKEAHDGQKTKCKAMLVA